jgi:antitoxin CptB
MFYYHFRTRGCGRIERPAFPAPSDVSDGKIQGKPRAQHAARSRNRATSLYRLSGFCRERLLTFADGIAISSPPGTSGLLAFAWESEMTGSTRSSSGLDDRRKRLLFRCWHRGTREMDLILGRFADAEIAGLGEAELAQLEQLIEVPDPDLYAALTGNGPLRPEYAGGLFDRIKAFRPVDHGA